MKQLNKKLVNKTKEFVKKSFLKNPHFSFNDWTVMYEHSVKTMEIAREIAEDVPGVDTDILAIGALLHDIGKTYQADDETLHTEHESFNLQICEDFLNELGLSPQRLNELKNVVSYQSESEEMRIVKDADAVALYADKRLYMLFIEWAVKNNLDWAIKRKIDKFERLNLKKSREIGEPLLKSMSKDWEEYQRLHK